MIVNGNYLFLDFEKYKPMFVDIFAKYYGEEYREEIQSKFDRVNYYGYHDYRDVVDYYNDYLTEFQDEIIDEFFKMKGLEYSEELKNAIFPPENDFCGNSIAYACNGGKIIDDIFTENAKRLILERRNLLKDIFSLDEDNLYNEIVNLKKDLYKAIDIIEERHDCDVFRDVRNIRKNKQDLYKQYLLELEDLGIYISATDMARICDGSFDDMTPCDLDVSNIFYCDSFLDKGAVDYFLQDEEDFESFDDRFTFLYGRLKFLEYSGVEFKFIEKLKDLNEDHNSLNLLELEYAYQKKNFKKLKTVHCEDVEMWKKEWRKGNFLPRHIAESIEYVRDELQDQMFIKCKNFDFYKRNKFRQGLEYSTSFAFDIKDNMKPYFNVFIDENITNKEYILSSFIHELNHVLGFYPMSKTEGMIDCKEGVSLLSFEYLNKFDEEKKHWEDSKDFWSYSEDEELTLLQENINERLALEIYELFLQHYENPFVSNKTEIEESRYTDYDFITEEFYKANKKLLKKNVLEKTTRNLYYDDRGFFEKTGPLGTLKRWVKGKVYKRQDENRTKFSILDLKRLGSIIGYFEKEVLYFVSKYEITREQIENGEYKNILKPEESSRLEFVLQERERFNKKLQEERKKVEKDESILEN